jgi:hypothetical protein
MPKPPQPKESQNKKTIARAILSSGIPLEMAVYDLLATGIDTDWIEAEYSFTALNENGIAIQRSVDFVSSTPTYSSPLDERRIRLYFIVECKYCNPEEIIWLFMPNAMPNRGNVFDEWRPALWQDREPFDPIARSQVAESVKAEIKKASEDCQPQSGTQSSDSVPRSVRGTTLNYVKGERGGPVITTAIHQIRDCLHYLSTERFRLFTKEWSQPGAIVFIPVVVTNVDLRLLKPGIHKRLLASKDTRGLALDDISIGTSRVLLRCPSSLNQIDWKWDKFNSIHGGHDLSQIEKGLPVYKRDRTIEYHMRNFFKTTPEYVTVVSLEGAMKLFTEVVEWGKRLEF